MPRLVPMAAAACLLAAGWSVPAAAAAAPRAFADFDRDGYGDLAIGVPNAAPGGAVVVLYGTPGGLRTGGAQRWTQDSPGIAGTSEPNDEFGAAVATGDFDGDGYTDLAVGAPGERKDHWGDGVVHVLHGSPSGLTATRNELWWPGAAGVPGPSAVQQRFGAALATGDLTGDGRADLAVGGPGAVWEHDVTESSSQPGAVWVLYGGSPALRPGAWIPDPEQRVSFGSALAIGDFDGDRRGDLALGAPLARAADGTFGGGRVWVHPGSAGGVSAARRAAFDQDTSGVVGTPEQADGFGGALAAADFDRDGRADLAVGAVAEDVGDAKDAGAVTLLRGSATGLTGRGSQLWHLDVPGVPGRAQRSDDDSYFFDFFGAELTAGDFDRDGRADLAIGAPAADAPRADTRPLDAGIVVVLRGGTGGLTTSGARLWDQGVAGVPGNPEDEDDFGAELATGDFDGNGRADLAVGSPSELVTLTRTGTTGAANVLYSGGSGLGAAGAQLWHLDVPGVPGYGRSARFATGLAG